MRASISRLGLFSMMVALLLAGCAFSPRTQPTTVVGTDALIGTVTGLDPGASATLRLDRLAEKQLPGAGEVVQRFQVANGFWKQGNLALTPGRYGLVSETQGYVGVPGSLTFQVPDGITWLYVYIGGQYGVAQWEFLHPADAPARFGAPLCAQPSPYGGLYVAPPAPPTATPTFAPRLPPGTLYPTPPYSPGTCYAGHFTNVDLSGQFAQSDQYGMHGHITGLVGKNATVKIYKLPPVPGETYDRPIAPPPGYTPNYPPEVKKLSSPPSISPSSPLTATLTISNGTWGLIDPWLAGAKYIVTAESPGQMADPPGYEVVVFDGMWSSFVDKVDFAFK